MSGKEIMMPWTWMCQWRFIKGDIFKKDLGDKTDSTW